MICLSLLHVTLCFMVCHFIGELESDDDEVNEDDIVYVENLAKRVNTLQSFYLLFICILSRRVHHKGICFISLYSNTNSCRIL